MIKNKTIVCQVSSFDSLFNQWVEQETSGRALIGYQRKFDVISVQHDGENHYILYRTWLEKTSLGY